ncbi:hypothetical protein ABIE44_000713 [Marmoricola sp. OAE513]|uniref:hypothetical protein n=1 Tax=Marmoricola sp. OAE513 TaxID=2817894 RepID=UPI001AE940E9
MEAETSPDPRQAPVPLRVAAAVVALEGVFAVVFGAVEAFATTSERAVMGATTSLFFVAFGAGIVLCAWGLSKVRSWARGPVMLAQLMSLGLAWNFRGGETWWISVVLAVPAVIGLVGMLHPETVAALNEE